MILSRIVRDSAEVLLHVWGSTTERETRTVISPKDLKDGPSHLRMTSIAFFITNGEVRLYWEGVDEHTLLMPLAGRASYALDWCAQALADPKSEGWTGNILIDVVPNGECHFTLVLEFAKQRG